MQHRCLHEQGGQRTFVVCHARPSNAIPTITISPVRMATTNNVTAKTEETPPTASPTSLRGHSPGNRLLVEFPA